MFAGIKKYKITIIFILVLVGILAVLVRLGDAQRAGDSLLSSQDVGVDGSAAGKEIVRLLREVQQIKFETTIFDRRDFQELADFSRPRFQEALGRANPFLPIGTGVNLDAGYVTPNTEETIIDGYEQLGIVPAPDEQETEVNTENEGDSEGETEADTETQTEEETDLSGEPST